MTFTKINKSSCVNRKKIYQGQAVFEYFILTIVVVGIFLFLAGGFNFNSSYFKSFKNSCENAFNQAIGEILK